MYPCLGSEEMIETQKGVGGKTPPSRAVRNRFVYYEIRNVKNCSWGEVIILHTAVRHTRVTADEPS